MKANIWHTVTIDTSIRSIHGDKMAAPYTFSFKTLPFMVTGLNPSNGAVNVPLTSRISIYFSGLVDTGTVRHAFSVNPYHGGYFDFDYGSVISFRPSYGWSADTTYTVTIDSSVRSRNDDKMSVPYTYSFRTVPFSVTSTNPTSNSLVSRNLAFIEVNFNAAPDTGTITSAFSTSGISGTLSYFDGLKHFFFFIDSTLAANTTYTATISTGLKSKNGYPLRVPYSISFTTGD